MRVIRFEAVSDQPDLIAHARTLFSEYQVGLGIDLCFQGFEAELAELPGKYGPPGGELIVAMEEDKPVACGALRPLETGIAELKRIYIRPTHRRLGLAERISLYLIETARKLGYSSVRLDTLGRLAGAKELYLKLGFKAIAPYNYNPEDDILYFEKRL